jgi:hypothetical protein
MNPIRRKIPDSSGGTFISNTMIVTMTAITPSVNASSRSFSIVSPIAVTGNSVTDTGIGV